MTNYSRPVEKPVEQSISVVRNWHKSYVLADVIGGQRVPVSIGSDGNSCCTSISKLSPWKLHGEREGAKGTRKKEREGEIGILAAVIVA